ncbi:hypothetical protein ACHQM5_020555 [Ranunculus cassubicifolius]
METSEHVLETIYEEETLDDVDMIDAQGNGFEEGEIKISKSKRKKRNKKKKKPKSVSSITDVNRFVLDTCRRLKERKSYLVWNAVGCLGVGAVSHLVKEVDAIQACGGQMTADGNRTRNGGGILWNILKAREPRAYKEIMTKGKELEKQFRKPSFKQGATQAKDNLSTERIGNEIDDLASENETHKVQDELESFHCKANRVSALDRLRVPVSYEDLIIEGEIKDESL